MPGNKYTEHSERPNTRVARLLRERELRRNNRRIDGIEGDRRTDVSENDISVTSYVEQYLEGAERALHEGERPHGRATKQRLLVVANRLPVSAVRRGEDSWSLEISAGGLVSALLGEHSVCCLSALSTSFIAIHFCQFHRLMLPRCHRL